MYVNFLSSFTLEITPISLSSSVAATAGVVLLYSLVDIFGLTNDGSTCSVTITYSCNNLDELIVPKSLKKLGSHFLSLVQFLV